MLFVSVIEYLTHSNRDHLRSEIYEFTGVSQLVNGSPYIKHKSSQYMRQERAHTMYIIIYYYILLRILRIHSFRPNLVLK